MKVLLTTTFVVLSCFLDSSNCYAMRTGKSCQEIRQAHQIALKEARWQARLPVSYTHGKNTWKPELESYSFQKNCFSHLVALSSENGFRHRQAELSLPSAKLLACLLISSLLLQSVQALPAPQTDSSCEDEMCPIPNSLTNRYEQMPKSWQSQLDASWRESYQQNAAEKRFGDSCPFCMQIAAHEDDRNFFLKRTSNFAILLNLFPYNKGHLLIIPNTHIKDLKDLSTQARSELMDLLIGSTEILKKQLMVDSFNIGINLGKNSGASIPDHLHWHIIPRYAKEGLAFIHTIGHTNVLTWNQTKFYQQLKHAFKQ